MPKPLTEWIAERGWDARRPADEARLELRVVEAILAGNYTTSPQQRDRVASALEVAVDEVAFSQAGSVDHMYGHGPQFGRSP